MNRSKQAGYYLILVGIIFTSIFVTSCKVKRNITELYTDNLRISSLLENISAAYLDYETLEVKFAASFSQNNRTQNFQGLYRIGKDSIIWVTLGPSIGMEFIRLSLFSDSLKYIDRFNKQYYEGDYNILKKKSNINFNYRSIENLLSNKLLFGEMNEDSWKEFISENFNYRIEEDMYILERKLISNDSIHVNQFINNLEKIDVIPEIYKIREINWKGMSGSDFKIQFDDYLKDKTFNFPQLITVSVYNQIDTIGLTLKIKSMEIDKEQKYPFRINEQRFSKISN